MLEINNVDDVLLAESSASGFLGLPLSRLLPDLVKPARGPSAPAALPAGRTADVLPGGTVVTVLPADRVTVLPAPDRAVVAADADMTALSKNNNAVLYSDGVGAAADIATPRWDLLFVAVVLAAAVSRAVKDDSPLDTADLASGKTFRVTTCTRPSWAPT